MQSPGGEVETAGSRRPDNSIERTTQQAKEPGHDGNRSIERDDFSFTHIM